MSFSDVLNIEKSKKNYVIILNNFKNCNTYEEKLYYIKQMTDDEIVKTILNVEIDEYEFLLYLIQIKQFSKRLLVSSNLKDENVIKLFNYSYDLNNNHKIEEIIFSKLNNNFSKLMTLLIDRTFSEIKNEENYIKEQLELIKYK